MNNFLHTDTGTYAIFVRYIHTSRMVPGIIIYSILPVPCGINMARSEFTEENIIRIISWAICQVYYALFFLTWRFWGGVACVVCCCCLLVVVHHHHHHSVSSSTLLTLTRHRCLALVLLCDQPTNGRKSTINTKIVNENQPETMFTIITLTLILTLLWK